MPKALGDKGGATNPEQLFAPGYAACFGNAVIHVTQQETPKIRDDAVDVIAEIGLLPNGLGGLGLAVALDVAISGVDQASAKEIIAKAHQACPYSNAIRGNIDFAINVTAR